jgi:deoxyribonucleoside regulator
MKENNLSMQQLNEYRKIAYSYYKLKMSQNEIADRMNTSRQRINRILQKCEEIGIVTIEISDPDHYVELEADITQKYGLKDARVVKSLNKNDLYTDMGREGIGYLNSVLKDGDIIGFSRGRSISALVEEVANLKATNLTVTQLLGNVTYAQVAQTGKQEADNIIHRFAQNTNAAINMLYAPIIVQNAQLKESMMNDPSYLKAYSIIKNCNVAVVGIGAFDQYPDYMAGLFKDWSAESINQFSVHVAGEVCANFYDYQGKPIVPDFQKNIITTSLPDYMKIPIRIGIAGTKQKGRAIKGALLGNYINVLITDYDVARMLTC